MLAPTAGAVKPSAPPGGAVGQLREHNRAAVLRALLDAGPLSRTALAQRLGLTQPALSYLAADLLAAGLIKERPESWPMARRPRGRRSVPLDLAATARCAAAIHLGATGLEVGLVDLRARVIQRQARRIDHERWQHDPGAGVRAIAQQVREVTAAAGRPAGAILGAGAGVAGWVDGRQGVVRHHAQLDWRDVPLGSLLGEALGLPVLIEDHVRSMALAEAWFGAARHATSFALLYVGAVIGCSLVVDRRALRGRSAAAGQIGALPATAPAALLLAPAPAAAGGQLDGGALRTAPAATEGGTQNVQRRIPHPNPLPEGEGTGGVEPLELLHAPAAPAPSIEAAASEPALFQAARRLARAHPRSALAAWVAEASPGRVPPSHRLAALVAARTAAGEEDRAALDLLWWRAQALAPFLAQVAGTCDPELLVVAGPMGWDETGLQLRLLREAILDHAPALGALLPPLVPSAFGASGALAGAAALVLQEVYSPPLAAAAAPSALGAAVRQRAARPEVEPISRMFPLHE